MSGGNEKFSIEGIKAIKRLLGKEFEAPGSARYFSEGRSYLRKDEELGIENFHGDEEITFGELGVGGFHEDKKPTKELTLEELGVGQFREGEDFKGEESLDLELPEKKKTLGRELKEWIKDIAIAIVAAIIILQIIKPTIVVESSMENTLHSGDYVLLSRQSYTIFGEPERGDIIVFKSDIKDDNGNGKLLVKRIIGLPGDRISISGGRVYIDGVVQDESYLKDGYTMSDMEEVKVPEGKLFCMGDNRQNSIDSRSERIGFIDERDVLGRVIIRLFPIGDIKIF